MLHLQAVAASRVYMQSRVRRPAARICAIALLWFAVFTPSIRASRFDDPQGEAKWMQRIVDDFRAKLGVPQKVSVTIVPKNTLIVSVEPVDDRASAFSLTIEESFLSGLEDNEVKAALAHELGHVWIFTHHPYLHTESLANEIAKRLVGRDNLVQVYEKLWQRQGTTGDLARLIGD